MSYLDVVVSFLAALCLVNLVLVLAAIRRVSTQEHMPPRYAPLRLPLGSSIPEFSAVTVAGEERTRSDLLGAPSLIGFFSPNCAPCHSQLPDFIKAAMTISGGPSHVLAVVVGESDDAIEFTNGLADSASVVIEPRRGPLVSAFSATGFPTFYLTEPDGRIKVSGISMLALTDAIPA